MAAFAVVAQQQNDPNVDDPDLLTESAGENPLMLLGEEFNNSIPVLNNRFRIDYNVEEITMVFFREYGSSPVVLVRPDGSKVYSKDANETTLWWYDSPTYDLIKFKSPMPGPWQAVGNVLPTSRVMVLTEIQLDAEPLPQLIFSGEILKIRAELTNGGEPIQYKEFKDIIELKINFASTNNPNYNNFGTPTSEVARFYDDGRGMDERPMDGVFTGSFNLTIPSGEWRPTYMVETPLYTREVLLDNLLLMPNPVEIKINIDGTGETYHEMLIDAVREHVDIESLLVDGTVRFPNGETRHFSMTEPSPEARRYEIVSVDFGIYRVKITAYGKTVFGRDFILNVPEYTFTVDDPALSFDLADDQTAAATGSIDNSTDSADTIDGAEVEATEGESSSLDANASESPDPVDLELAQMEKRLAALGEEDEATFAEDELDPDLNAESGMSTTTLVIIIIVANLIVIIGGGLFLKRIILGPSPKKPKKKKVKKKKAKKGDSEESAEQKNSELTIDKPSLAE